MDNDTAKSRDDVLGAVEAIRARRSVRTFDGQPLSQKDAEMIESYASEASNPFGIPITWKIMDAEKEKLSSPVIVGASHYIAGKMKRVPKAEEAFGYSFEKIVLFAQSHGIGTTWIAGTMNRQAFEKAVGLGEGEVMPCVSPLGYPASKMSFRETVMRGSIKADTRDDFSALFFDGSFDTPLTPDKAGRLKDVLEAVRLSPSAVNRQPWRVVISGGKAHFYEKRSGGYVSSDGWDIQKIDIGIALCHFDLSAKEIGLDTALTFDDPGFETGNDVYYIATYTVS